ncbi:heme peroxidase [Mycobacterium dioxanotrophicus]|uniref:Heme peroxidase n=1 Tax=Mycobacterium dioxanotrophicus TaxID=482462 RepID=A0A1Y0C505_9MYCO|nr:heme peroxidase [Mycobacterium dioxanotrophicus]ART70270.1 heme peroxidase [Mycobacterium dioxanotrophicus]
MSTDVERLRAACERDLGDPADWPGPFGYPDALALCIIDAIYVTGARHLTVEKVVERYRGYRAAQGGDADTDGAPELLANVEELGGPVQWAAEIGNRRPTSTVKGAPLRSAALIEVAQALVGLGIRTTADLRRVTEDSERYAQAKAAWCAVPGQRSGFTWRYLVLLAQQPEVAADPSVAGYVDRELGAADPAGVARLLRDVSESAGWDAAALHHAIWRFESARRDQRELPSTA